LFGVLSYSTTQRAREIGVRTALGANPVNIVSLVLREALIMAVVGIAVGLAIAAGAVRWIASELYGVSPHDVAVFAGASLVVIVIAAIACIVPAMRALRTDPALVLRT